MGIVITKQEAIQQYFDADECNQSTLKLLFKNYKAVLESRGEIVEEGEKAHFIIGSAVDCILTGEDEEFKKQYYVSPLEKKPSPVEMQMIDAVFEDVIADDESPVGPLSNYRGSILRVSLEFNWQPRYKDETKIDKIIEVGSDYFEDIKKAHGKQILSQEQYNVITEVTMSLISNSKTSKYFDRENQGRNTSVDFYYQLPLYFVHKSVNCKALIDLVVVVKSENGAPVTVQGFDLKTMYGDTVDFLTAVKARRYDIQAAWYSLALEYWVTDDERFSENVEIKPFSFIVESTSDIGNPLVFRLTKSLLDIGRHGRQPLKLLDTNFFDDQHHVDEPIKDIIIAREIRGFESLMDEYIWYENTNWAQHKDIVENEKNGVLEINWNSII
jgi:hypothetical protein